MWISDLADEHAREGFRADFVHIFLPGGVAGKVEDLGTHGN